MYIDVRLPGETVEVWSDSALLACSSSSSPPVFICAGTRPVFLPPIQPWELLLPAQWHKDLQQDDDPDEGVHFVSLSHWPLFSF